MLPAGCLLHRNFCALRRGWLWVPGDLKISSLCLGQLTEQSCAAWCAVGMSSVWDVMFPSLLWSGLLHGGCFNGKTGQFFLPKTLLAAAQPSPYSLLLYSFDLFLIASKKSQTPPASYHPQAAHQVLSRFKLSSYCYSLCKTFPKCLTKIKYPKTSLKGKLAALRA